MSASNGWHDAHAELAKRIEAAIEKRSAKKLPNASDPGPDLRKLSALVAVLAILWASAEPPA